MGKRKGTKKSRAAKRANNQLWIHLREQLCSNGCAVCGNTNKTNLHHILAKKYWTAYRYDAMNLVPLCPLHHQFGKYSAEQNGMWFSDWLREHRPEQWHLALERIKQEIAGGT